VAPATDWPAVNRRLPLSWPTLEIVVLVTVYAAHQGWNDANQIVIADDGCGFDPQAAHAGRGLENMRERARQLGARLEITAADGAGTRVSLLIGSPEAA
jgi:nitrate/nitrite-specific signal transduction histidine kinase